MIYHFCRMKIKLWLDREG